MEITFTITAKTLATAAKTEELLKKHNIRFSITTDSAASKKRKSPRVVDDIMVRNVKRIKKEFPNRTLVQIAKQLSSSPSTISRILAGDYDQPGDTWMCVYGSSRTDEL